MPHLSELHGAATHLAVIAIPIYAILLLLRRASIAPEALRAISPWCSASPCWGLRRRE